MNGQIIEGKYYEQELLKSDFDFESDNKVLESLEIFLNKIMKRNRFNQAKQQTTTTISTISSPNHLKISKAHQSFLEDDNNIDMKSNYIVKIFHPPIDMKHAVNKEFCDNKLLSSNNKTDILSKNLTELRKGEIEEVTSGQLNANTIRLPSSLTNGGSVWIDHKTVELVSLNSSNISTLANKLIS